MHPHHMSERNLQASLLSGMRISHHVLPRHPLSSWLRALFWSVYVLAAFDAGHSRLAQATLNKAPLADRPRHQYPREVRCAAARLDAARLRTWLHLLLGDRACYSESFALCAGLRVLGWDCTLVSGYACMYMQGPTAMHAWVEYAGEAINDRSDIPLGYLEIERRGATR